MVLSYRVATRRNCLSLLMCFGRQPRVCALGCVINNHQINQPTCGRCEARCRLLMSVARNDRIRCDRSHHTIVDIAHVITRTVLLLLETPAAA